jgi:hypothetical protein
VNRLDIDPINVLSKFGAFTPLRSSSYAGFFSNEKIKKAPQNELPREVFYGGATLPVGQKPERQRAY